MSTTTTVPQPMSQRDVWLTIALAVAQGHIAAPYGLTVRDDIHMVSIDYREDCGQPRSDAIRAADHFGLPLDRQTSTPEGVHHATWYARRDDGWGWYVHAQLSSPLEALPEPSPLAEQVIAAIGGAS